MYRIRLMNKISPSGLEVLDKSNYICMEDMENPDGVMVRSADMHTMLLEPSIKAISRAGAGVNNIPVAACSENGVVVFNTPGANANAVKEMVIAALLMSSRRLHEGVEWTQSLKYSGEVEEQVEKGKSRFAGPELKGKTLGVVGLGAIGAMVANVAVHLGMEVFGFDPYISVDSAWSLSRSVVRAQSLKEICERCDYITLHLPQTPETKGMIHSAAIDSMKHGVRILNFSRGGLVADEDIITALEEGKVARYVTDFPSDALLGVKNVIAFPHLGASTPESEDNCAAMAASQLKDFLENGNIKNAVNMPSVSMERSGRPRIGVIHRNVPHMLARISQAVSDTGLNIDNMTNKSRGDYAYTILDVDGNAGADSVWIIQNIQGVIRVLYFH